VSGGGKGRQRNGKGMREGVWGMKGDKGKARG